MSKKPRKKKKKPQPNPSSQKKPDTRYSAGEIAMAILGAAILVMFAGIIITSLLG